MATYDLTLDEGTLPCSGGAQPGAVALLEVILRRHPRARSLGIYNCRPVRNGSSPSIHGNGRADDIDPGNDYDPEGDQIAAALVSAAPQLGVQRIIWNRRIWDQRRGWHPYTGPAGDHADHIHVELTVEAARTLTMTAVMAAFGQPRAPRKDSAVPTAKPTDRVAYLGLPKTKDSAGGVIALERQGGIITISGKPKFLGSMLMKGMTEDRRRSSGVFVDLVAGPQPGEYVIIDSKSHAYLFTRGLYRRLDAAEKA